jgi:uncharacterized protein (DUF4415 family)
MGMKKKKSIGAPTWRDADDAPELSKKWFEQADIYQGDKLVRRGRGRPKSEAPKQQVTLRLDQDVIAGMRATGPGWQARVNEALRRWVRRQHDQASG